MSHVRFIGAALVVGLALGGAAFTTGCRDRGPAERAGEQLDRAKEKVEDTLDPPRGPAERAGRKIDRALDDRKD